MKKVNFLSRDHQIETKPGPNKHHSVLYWYWPGVDKYYTAKSKQV